MRYARGDAVRGESLLEQALDLDLPWDEVCAAAARGVARHYTVLVESNSVPDRTSTDRQDRLAAGVLRPTDVARDLDQRTGLSRVCGRTRPEIRAVIAGWSRLPRAGAGPRSRPAGRIPGLGRSGAGPCRSGRDAPAAAVAGRSGLWRGGLARAGRHRAARAGVRRWIGADAAPAGCRSLCPGPRAVAPGVSSAHCWPLARRSPRGRSALSSRRCCLCSP